MTGTGIGAWALAGVIAAAGLRIIVQHGSYLPTGMRRLAPPVIPELVTASLFAVLAWRVGAKPDLAAHSWLAATAVPLIAIDWKTKKLPTKLLRSTGLILAVLLTVAAVVNSDVYPLVRALVGMLGLLAFYGLIYFLLPGHLGGGDLRLGGILGLPLGWTGWTTIPAGTLLTWTAAAMAVIALRTLGPLQAGRKIPLGPFLVAGTLAAVLVGTPS
jgi:leader peptidase (prepilin peptidase) / N-methyltransferase